MVRRQVQQRSAKAPLSELANHLVTRAAAALLCVNAPVVPLCDVVCLASFLVLLQLFVPDAEKVRQAMSGRAPPLVQASVLEKLALATVRG